jgi:hypothetical protein
LYVAIPVRAEPFDYAQDRLRRVSGEVEARLGERPSTSLRYAAHERNFFSFIFNRLARPALWGTQAERNTLASLTDMKTALVVFRRQRLSLPCRIAYNFFHSLEQEHPYAH